MTGPVVCCLKRAVRQKRLTTRTHLTMRSLLIQATRGLVILLFLQWRNAASRRFLERLNAMLPAGFRVTAGLLAC